MAIGLVPRSARALSEHVNRYYRILKGVDPESVVLRLPSGGAFTVQHSVTAAPVFTVTDAGLSGAVDPGSIGTSDLADGAVTSLKIADGTIVNADIAAGAGIDGAKLLDGSVTSAKILDGTLLDGDVSASAGIGVTKLAHVGANNVLRSNGTSNVGGQVVNADVAPAAAIAVSKLAAGGTANRVPATTDGATVAMAQVTGAMIASATLLNGNFTPNTINGDKILDASIASAKLIGGATIPANSIDSSHIIDGSIASADLAAHAATNGGFVSLGSGAAVAAGGGLVDIPGGFIDLTGVLTTSEVLVVAVMSSSGSVASAYGFLAVTYDAVPALTDVPTVYPSVSTQIVSSVVGRFTGMPAGTRRIKAQWRAAVSGTTTLYGLQMWAVELRR